MCSRLLSEAAAEPRGATAERLLRWLADSAPQEDSDFSCSRSDFSIYFINHVRTKTQSILKCEEANDANQSPAPRASIDESDRKDASIEKSYKEKESKFKVPKRNNSGFAGVDENNVCVISDPKNEQSPFRPSASLNDTYNSLTVSNQTRSESSDASTETCSSIATPKRNDLHGKNLLFSPVTPVNNSNLYNHHNSWDRFSTPNTSKTPSENVSNSKFNTFNNHSKDHANFSHSTSKKSSNDRNICIGDFMVSNKSNFSENSSNKKKKSRFLNLSLDDPLINSNKENSKFQSNLNKSSPLNIDDKNMFPDIGSHKSQNHDLKSGNNRNNRRRIKPTRLNMTYPNEDRGANANANVQLNTKFGVKYDKSEQNDAFKVQDYQIKEPSTDFNTERDILRKEKVNLIEKFNEISNNTPKKILTVSTPVHTLTPKRINKNIMTVMFDLDKVDNMEVLTLFSSIFSTIIDSNLIPNIMSELYFLISLATIHQINVETSNTSDVQEILEAKDHKESIEETNVLSKLFDNVHNCVYFASSCLEKQKDLLKTILDKNCLKLLVQNERIKMFSTKFVDSLTIIYTEKVATEDKNLSNVLSQDISNRNVCFITETDSADNFPSHQNFITFKSQRDHFYEVFRIWESNHQSPNWTFDVQLGPKVRTLISMSTNPSNMAHLARLFKSQLLVTCTIQKKSNKEETIAHLQSVIGGSGINQNKLSKLAERLTSALPSQSNKLIADQNFITASPEFLEYEEFFKDFILNSNHSTFREHLVNSITQEICKLDETGFLPSENENSGTNLDEDEKTQYIMCMKSLKILAKFLGFLMSLPYRSQEKTSAASIPGVNKLIENSITKTDTNDYQKNEVAFSEISVRNQTLPPINLILILNNSYKKRRLVLTIPWIVQLLSMLDFCYLRLTYFKQIHQMLFDIYASDICKPNMTSITIVSINDQKQTINPEEHSQEITMPHNNKSLIRICLGWLFDLQNFPRDLFYLWQKSSKNLKVKDCDVIFKNHGLFLKNVENTNTDVNKTNTDNLNNDDIRRLYNLSLEARTDELEHNLDSLEIINDSIIKEMCPFLKDFQSLFLKNQKSNKDKENMKNIRHITPVTSRMNIDKPKRKEKELQMRLEEWFLRSQAGTTRRTLELVSERTGAALIRLAKTQISVYCSRAYAAAESFIVEPIDEEMVGKIAEIYNRHLLEFHLGCKRAGQHVGIKRVRSALQGLLPPGTHTSILQMCIEICTRNAVRKLIHCLETQYNDINVLINNNNLKKVFLNVNNDYYAEQRAIMLHQYDKDDAKDHLNHQHSSADKHKKHPVRSHSVDEKMNDKKNFEDVYYSVTMLIIELKETIINLLSNRYSIEDANNKIPAMLKKFQDCNNYPHVDKLTKSILLQLSIDLTVCLVCLNPLFINEQYLSQVGEAWKSCYNIISCESTLGNKSDISSYEIISFGKLMNDENFNTDDQTKNFEKHISPYDDLIAQSILQKNESTNEKNITENHSKLDVICESSTNYFNTILCSRNLLLIKDFHIAANYESKWKALGCLLVYLLKNNFLTEDSLTEQFVAIYRQEWPQEFLENISKCIKNLIEKCDLHSNDRLTMMLEFISDFCKDLDDYI